MSYARPMPAYLPSALVHTSVGRRSSARTPSVGETSPGGLTLIVLPSAAAVAAATVDCVADGEVAVCVDCVQATPAINRARLEPRRKNFIKQVSKRCGRRNAARCKELGTHALTWPS